MRKICVYIFGLLFAAFLLVSSSFGSFTASVNVFNAGVIRSDPASTFQIRGADLGLDMFFSGNPAYQPNAWQMLADLNINHIRCGPGWYGDVAGININSRSNWAQNLDNFLTHAASHGITLSFIAMGYNSAIGQITYGSMSLSDAEILIDKLAGDTSTSTSGGRTFYGNTLGHNFLTDPRVYVWTTSNEQDLSSQAARDWNLGLCDYIRNKGGRAEIAYARVAGDWDYHTTETGNLLYGHVDQVNYHEYGEYAYAQYFQKSLTRTWNGMTYYQWWVNQFQDMLSTPHFAADQIVLGEYGCWIGTGSNEGLSGVTFTNQDRLNIYNTVFAAAEATGFKNLIFHYVVGYPTEVPDYGIYKSDHSGDYWDDNLANVIREAYS